MYEDYTAVKAIGYYFIRFVIPLFVAESLCIFTLPKRKWWLPFYLSSSLLYFMLCMNVVYFNIDLKIGWFRIIFLIIFLLSLIPMFATYKLRPKQIILFALSAYAVQNLGDNLSSLIVFVSGLSDSKYELYQSLIYTGIYMISFVPYYFLFVSKLKGEMIPDLIEGNVVYLMTIITLVVVYIVSMFAQSTSDFVGYISSRLYAMIACMFLLILHYNTYYRKKLQNQNAMLEQIVHNENEKFKQSKKNMELINMRIHDLKHQVEGLKEYAKSKQEISALESLEKELQIYDKSIETGNATIDFILAEKSLYCKEHNIRFSSLIDGEKLSFMNSADIYSLFENGLDNAIEAVLKANEEDRTITINVVAKNSFLIIHIENFCNEEVEFINGLPMTKKDKSFHGYGTRSIERVVKKYGGSLTFRFKNNIFSLNAVFPLDVTSNDKKD
mgnify:FL=1